MSPTENGRQLIKQFLDLGEIDRKKISEVRGSKFLVVHV
jgi:hypothetical protein